MAEYNWNVWNIDSCRWTNTAGPFWLYQKYGWQNINCPLKYSRNDADQLLQYLIANDAGVRFEVRQVVCEEIISQSFNVWNVEANRWTDWDHQDYTDPQDMTKEEADKICFHLNQVNGGKGYEVRPLHRQSEHTIASTIPSPPINDKTCLVCKNDRCSQTEKLCWKCGNPL